MTIEIFDMDQRSDDWRSARSGIATASVFSKVMASGKDGADSIGRKDLMMKIAGEILTGDPMPEGYVSADMERGRIMEDEARDYYAFTKRTTPRQVGFIRNGRMGCSPDSLIDADGGLEIKSAAPHVQIARLLRAEKVSGNDKLPPEHKAQVQGVMMVAELQWLDFVSYSPKLPALIVRVTPDPEYMGWLRAGIDGFNRELDAMVAKIRSME